MKRVRISFEKFIHGLSKLYLQALINAKFQESLYSDILYSTRHIMFFGTPHRGASHAGIMDFLSNLSTVLGYKAKSNAAK